MAKGLSDNGGWLENKSESSSFSRDFGLLMRKTRASAFPGAVTIRFNRLAKTDFFRLRTGRAETRFGSGTMVAVVSVRPVGAAIGSE